MQTAPPPIADPAVAWRASIPRGDGEDGARIDPAPLPGGGRRARLVSPVARREPNDTIDGILYEARDPVAGAIVLPGYRSGMRVERDLCADLAAHGISAYLMYLPYQQTRAAPGVESDDWTLSADLDRNERVLTQALADIRRARRWLAAEAGLEPERIGIVGLSLGGIVAAAAYGVDPDIRAAVVAYAGGGIADLLWHDSWLNEMAGWKADLVRQGLTQETLRARCRLSDPLTHARPGRASGILLIASRFDEIIPPANVEALSDAFGGAPVSWTAGGHVQACLAISLQHERIREHLLATTCAR